MHTGYDATETSVDLRAGAVDVGSLGRSTNQLRVHSEFQEARRRSCFAMDALTAATPLQNTQGLRRLNSCNGTSRHRRLLRFGCTLSGDPNGAWATSSRPKFTIDTLASRRGNQVAKPNGGNSAA